MIAPHPGSCGRCHTPVATGERVVVKRHWWICMGCMIEAAREFEYDRRSLEEERLGQTSTSG